jgi:hypothetical protein
MISREVWGWLGFARVVLFSNQKVKKRENQINHANHE